MSKETKALEDALATKRNAVLSLTEKIADLDARIEKATHGARPALREEILDLRADLAKAQAAAREAELPIARSREADARAALVATFRDVNVRAAAAGKTARTDVVTAARSTSEAAKLAKAASEFAMALGGAPLGYTLSPDAFTVSSSSFGGISYGEVRDSTEIRWPTIAVNLAVPSPPGPVRLGGLVGHDELEKHRALEAELAARGK